MTSKLRFGRRSYACLADFKAASAGYGTDLDYVVADFNHLTPGGYYAWVHQSSLVSQRGGAYPAGVDVPNAPVAFVTGIEAVVPNPTRASLRMNYALSRGGAVRFEAMDMAGCVVWRHEPGTLDAGRWNAEWSGADPHGRRLAPGLYFVRMPGGRSPGVAEEGHAARVGASSVRRAGPSSCDRRGGAGARRPLALCWGPMARTEWSFEVRTPEGVGLVNVTRQLEQAVRESGVESGIACAFVPHATCALALNEDEAGLREDVKRLVTELLEPLRARKPFAHDRIDDNAAAHLGAILLQPSLVIPISGGRAALGTWQQLFVVEMDGPRTRTLRVTVR